MLCQTYYCVIALQLLHFSKDKQHANRYVVTVEYHFVVVVVVVCVCVCVCVR